MARTSNGVTKQDAYREKQKNLGSQILEQTDYSEHLPLQKVSLQVMNDPVVVHSPPTQISKGLKVNEVFK